jgi:hypothetical protein
MSPLDYYCLDLFDSLLRCVEECFVDYMTLSDEPNPARSMVTADCNTLLCMPLIVGHTRGRFGLVCFRTSKCQCHINRIQLGLTRMFLVTNVCCFNPVRTFSLPVVVEVQSRNIVMSENVNCKNENFNLAVITENETGPMNSLSLLSLLSLSLSLLLSLLLNCS